MTDVQHAGKELNVARPGVHLLGRVTSMTPAGFPVCAMYNVSVQNHVLASMRGPPRHLGSQDHNPRS